MSTLWFSGSHNILVVRGLLWLQPTQHYIKKLVCDSKWLWLLLHSSSHSSSLDWNFWARFMLQDLSALNIKNSPFQEGNSTAKILIYVLRSTQLKSLLACSIEVGLLSATLCLDLQHWQIQIKITGYGFDPDWALAVNKLAHCAMSLSSAVEI